MPKRTGAEIQIKSVIIRLSCGSFLFITIYISTLVKMQYKPVIDSSKLDFILYTWRGKKRRKSIEIIHIKM